MIEEISIEQEFIEAAKAEMLKNPKLQPCAMCMHFDPEKKWCHFYRQPKQTYNYGANCFVTNEIALKALLIQERKRSIERKAILRKKMASNIAMTSTMPRANWLTKLLRTLTKKMNDK
jgi:hypothetical protein